MTMEIASASALGPASPVAGGAAQAGYGVSLSDIGGFEHAMAGAQLRLEAHVAPQPSQAAQQLMKPFEQINAQATQIALDANAAGAAGRDMTPSEMVNLSMRCQEFMFNCQLTSNIANKTSEGVQQLFRQQS
jgi:hypothetical protein